MASDHDFQLHDTSAPVHALCAFRTEVGTVLLSSAGSGVRAACSPNLLCGEERERSSRRLLVPLLGCTEVLAAGHTVHAIVTRDWSGRGDLSNSGQIGTLYFDFLVIGGRQLRFVRLERVSGFRGGARPDSDDNSSSIGSDDRWSLFPISHCMEAADWIWDAKMLTSDRLEGLSESEGRDRVRMVLADAHNRLHSVSVRVTSTLGGRASEMRPTNLKSDVIVKGPAHCILYSSALLVDDDRVLCAAGTVFGEVVVWQVPRETLVPNDSSRLSSNVQVEQRVATLVGIRGVVNSVAFCPEDPSMLCASSDDRSTCVWTKVSLTCPKESDTPLTTPATYRCDGFHNARVWSSVLVDGGKWLLTAAEDAKIGVWRLDDGHGRGHAELMTSVSGHRGKNVWCLLVTMLGNGADGLRVISGGGDGAVMDVCLRSLLEPEVVAKKFPVQVTSSNIDRASGSLRAATLVRSTRDSLAVTSSTSTGAMLRRDSAQALLPISGEKMTEQSSRKSTCLFSQKVSASEHSFELLACGDTAGVVSVSVVSVDTVSATGTVSQRCHMSSVLSVWLFPTSDERTFYCVSSAHDGSLMLQLYRVDTSGTTLEAMFQLSLEIPQTRSKPAKTSAVCLHEQYIIAGDSNGSIHGFLLPDLATSQSSPIFTIPQAHVHEPVTHLYACNDESQVDLFSTGGDGKVRHFELSKEDLSLKPVPVSTFAVSFDGGKKRMSHVRGLWCPERRRGTHNDLAFVWGVWSTDFVCLLQPLSGGPGDVLVKVDCGGIKRLRDVFFDEFHRTLNCCWGDASGTILTTCQISLDSVEFSEDGASDPEGVIWPAGHARHVNGVVSIASGRMFATCSDDGTVKTWALGATTGRIELCQSLVGHSSNVRALALGQGDSHEELFSGGGMSEIRAWRLREVAGSLEYIADGKALLSANRDDKCRVMAVDANYLGSGVFLLAVGMSDGRLTLQVHRQDSGHGGVFSTLLTADFHQCAIVSVSATLLRPAQSPEDTALVMVVSGGTDGRIWVSTFSISALYVPSTGCSLLSQNSLACHACGVNDLVVVRSLGDESADYFVVSVGDDQMINIVGVCVDGSEIVSFLTRCDPVPAHNAAITGITCELDPVSRTYTLATAGADQRVHLWRFLANGGGEEPNLTWTDGTVVAIPDCSGIGFYRETVILTGAGFSCFKRRA